MPPDPGCEPVQSLLSPHLLPVLCTACLCPLSDSSPERLVFGTGLGIATKRSSTKNRVAPIPIATTVLIPLLLFIFISSLVFSLLWTRCLRGFGSCYRFDTAMPYSCMVYDALQEVVNCSQQLLTDSCYDSPLHHIGCQCTGHIQIGFHIAGRCCIDTVTVCHSSHRADTAGIGISCHRSDFIHL